MGIKLIVKVLMPVAHSTRYKKKPNKNKNKNTVNYTAYMTVKFKLKEIRRKRNIAPNPTTQGKG